MQSFFPIDIVEIMMTQNIPSKKKLHRKRHQAAQYGIQPVEQQRTHKILSLWGHIVPEINETLQHRDIRKKNIHDALLVDSVLTKEQLVTYFHADQQDLEILQSIPHIIEPVHMRSTQIFTSFFGLTISDVNKHASFLAHQVGTAQIRLQLGIDSQAWHKTSKIAHTDIEPDAFFITQDEKHIAIEYDRGTYPAKKVIKKLLNFTEMYDGVIWAVPPPRITAQGIPSKRSRHKFLHHLISTAPELKQIRSPIHIICVEWWRNAQILRQ